MFENLNHEIAIKRFISIKEVINKGLFGGNRFLPRQTTNIQDILFNHTRVVTDEEHREEIIRVNSLINLGGSKMQKIIDEHAQGANASYLPPLLGEATGQILIKDSFLANATTSDDTALEAVLEELSHSYYRSKEMKFEDIPENSMRLFPDDTKVAYIEKLRLIGNTYFDKNFQIDPSKLVVRTFGFVNSVWDPGLGQNGELLPYPIDLNQHVLEETRALLLKTIFFAKVKGTKISPYGSIMDQVADGLIYISKLKKTMGLNTDLIAGMPFIAQYSNSPLISKDGLQGLMLMLHEADPDIFYDKISQITSTNKLLDNSFSLIDKSVRSRF